MRIGESMLAEWDQEMATTRRLLERVPSEKGEWKPHEKSFPLGHLAQLVARMPGWMTFTLRQPKLDLSQGAGYSMQTTEELLRVFDANVAEGREALATVSDEDMAKEWSLTNGDHALFTLPRQVVARQNVNHLVHHRGQLSVYLRLLDVPLPSIYGPTADEKWG